MSWPLVSLGDIAEITMGQAPKGNTYNENRRGLPLIAGAGDFPNGTLKVKKFTDKPTKVCKAGDIILGIRATIGVKVVSDGKYCLGRGVVGVRPSPDLDARFLWHGLTQTNTDLLRKARGATFVQVSRKDIAELLFPLPPIEEQRRIAGILDAADALCRSGRDALALLDTLPGAIFEEMFGGLTERYTLREAKTDFRYGTSSKSQDHGLPVLRIPNVVGGDIDLAEIKTVPLNAKEEARFALQDGDILLVRTNGNQSYVGRSAVFAREKVADHDLADATWSFASYLIRARLDKSELLPDFLQGFLQSTEGRKQLLASSKTSAGQFNINTEALGAIRVPKAAMKAQYEFVNRVAEIRSYRSKILVQRSDLEDLLTSLQSRAFAGAL